MFPPGGIASVVGCVLPNEGLVAHPLPKSFSPLLYFALNSLGSGPGPSVLCESIDRSYYPLVAALSVSFPSRERDAINYTFSRAAAINNRTRMALR